MSGATHSEKGAAHGGDAMQAVRGPAVAADDLRLVVDQPELRGGRTADLRFRIVDARGETLRDFDVTHEKRMHLLLARRDLTGFQHGTRPRAPTAAGRLRSGSTMRGRRATVAVPDTQVDNGLPVTV